MNPDERRLRDVWLAELWPVCREVPRDVRAGQRALDRRFQRDVEELAVNSTSTDCAQEAS